MALGYIAIGMFAGLLAAAMTVAGGGGLGAGLAILSAAGTLATLAAVVAGARCPELARRAID